MLMRWPAIPAVALLAIAANAQTPDKDWLLDRAVKLYASDPDSARYYSNEVVKLVGVSADSLDLALAYKRIGLSYQTSNQHDDALRYFRNALAIETRFRHEPGIISTLQKTGLLLGEMGRTQEGVDLVRDALQRSERLGEEESIARCCVALASLCTDIGLIEEAVNYTFRAVGIYKHLGSQQGIRSSTYSLACLYARVKRFDESYTTHKDHLAMERSIGDPVNLAHAYLGIAEPLYHMDRFEEARAYADSALVIFRDLVNPKGTILARTSLAAALAAMGRISEAEDEYRSLLRMINTHGTDEDRAETLFALASLLNGSGRAAEAEIMLKQVIDWCQGSRNQLLELDALDELAESLKEQGRLSESLVYFERARDIQDSLFSKGTERELASAEMREKYDAEGRNAEIRELRTEIDLREERERRRTLERNLLIGMSVALLVFAVLLVWNLQHRKRLMQQQQAMHEKDVNDLLQQQEIRSLEAMLDGLDKERNRIAQDLHDVLGSKLSATKMQFNSMEPKVNGVGHEQHIVYEKVSGMLDEAVAEVRRISHDMARGSVTRTGLASALQDLRNTIEVPGTLEVELSIFGMEARLEQHTELVLFRIVQELVSNALKHARANHLVIQLTRNNDGVNVIVEDNGTGFDTTNTAAGLGLTGVRARASELRGRVEVDSARGRGTTVMIEVPLLTEA